jgi:glyoxylase-like metal-dependent hydrolase (beta-lactamase superfamily II)
MMKALIFAFLLASSAPATAAVQQSAATQLAPGAWVVLEIRSERREPDGNSVIFESPAGLIVVDTGRHAWHRDALLSLAVARRRPIVAVINSHWHLDHDSGNPFLRESYPHLTVYASSAIDEALRGFLADSLRKAPTYLADASLPAETREDIAADRLTILNGAALKPDVVVASSKSMRIGGRVLRVNLARRAATAGDVWVIEPKSGVAALGDLVTLPVPYFETACPAGWSKALRTVTETRFKTAIPGHGPALSPAEVLQYRMAFDGFLRCAESSASAAQCAAEWSEAVQSLLSNGGYSPARAKDLAAYYVGLLRDSSYQKRYCELG